MKKLRSTLYLAIIGLLVLCSSTMQAQFILDKFKSGYNSAKKQIVEFATSSAKKAETNISKITADFKTQFDNLENKFKKEISDIDNNWNKTKQAYEKNYMTDVQKITGVENVDELARAGLRRKYDKLASLNDKFRAQQKEIISYNKMLEQGKNRITYLEKIKAELKNSSDAQALQKIADIDQETAKLKTALTSLEDKTKNLDDALRLTNKEIADTKLGKGLAPELKTPPPGYEYMQAPIKAEQQVAPGQSMWQQGKKPVAARTETPKIGQRPASSTEQPPPPDFGAPPAPPLKPQQAQLITKPSLQEEIKSGVFSPLEKEAATPITKKNEVPFPELEGPEFATVASKQQKPSTSAVAESKIKEAQKDIINLQNTVEKLEKQLSNAEKTSGKNSAQYNKINNELRQKKMWLVQIRKDNPEAAVLIAPKRSSPIEEQLLRGLNESTNPATNRNASRVESIDLSRKYTPEEKGKMPADSVITKLDDTATPAQAISKTTSMSASQKIAIGAGAAVGVGAVATGLGLGLGLGLDDKDKGKNKEITQPEPKPSMPVLPDSSRIGNYSGQTPPAQLKQEFSDFMSYANQQVTALGTQVQSLRQQLQTLTQSINQKRQERQQATPGTAAFTNATNALNQLIKQYNDIFTNKFQPLRNERMNWINQAQEAQSKLRWLNKNYSK